MYFLHNDTTYMYVHAEIVTLVVKYMYIQCVTYILMYMYPYIRFILFFSFFLNKENQIPRSEIFHKIAVGSSV